MNLFYIFVVGNLNLIKRAFINNPDFNYEIKKSRETSVESYSTT